MRTNTHEHPLLVLVAGPYRSGTNDDPVKLAENVDTMNRAALATFRAGHGPVTRELLATSGRVVATELQDAFGVSGYTIRRDLDELAREGAVQRVHGGALGRSRVAHSYEDRQTQEVEGKRAVARAAASLLRGGEVAILDGGSTA